MAELTAPAAPPSPVTRLTCHAPHPDPKKKGHACGGFLGHVHGAYDFVTSAPKAPQEPGGFTWLLCPRESCRQWNKWHLVTALVPTLPEGSIEERLAKFPVEQQQAILALGSGLGYRQTAGSIGIDRRTIFRWRENPEFMALRREVAPALSATHMRVALEALFELIEKDKKKGVGTHIRWFLARTMFSEFEKDRAQRGATAINLNVAQHQQQTQATVKSVWEDRQRAITAPVAPTE